MNDPSGTSPNSPSPFALPTGTELKNGAFVVREVLGQGGFGITYRAFDNNLHRDAAIKEFFPRGSTRDAQSGAVLAPSSSELQAAKEQFLHEARALAQFNHPNIVNVYSIFEANDTAYMVMEWVRGRTLSQLVEERGAAPEKEALSIIEQVASALAEVHRGGFLHLDIKPDNVMVEESGTRAVLLDFGLTRKIERAAGYGTVRLDTLSRFGTPGFAAIEQYSARGATGTFTDVYGLAATLFFLLSGETPPEATARATGAPLPDISAAIRPTVARALEKALRLSPEERPQTIEECMDALRSDDSATLQALPVPAPSTPPPSAPPKSTPPPVRDPFDELFSRPPRTAPRQRPRVYDQSGTPGDNPFENHPFGNSPFGRTPFSIFPFGFGCSGIGCSMGCFLFIMFFLMIIASLLNSVSGVFIL